MEYKSRKCNNFSNNKEYKKYLTTSKNQIGRGKLNLMASFMQTQAFYEFTVQKLPKRVLYI